MPPKLHFTCAGDGPPVVLLHGLFGSGSNLGALARALRREFTVYAPDLPNHGRSDWLAELDLPLLAQLLQYWLQQQDLSSAAFVGHSLGGKVAMQLALDHPESVSSLVVADIAPVAYPPHHDAVFTALEAVAIAQCKSRDEAAQLMTSYLEEQDVVQFLLASLARNQQGNYDWRFNLQDIRQGYAGLRAAPQDGSPYEGPVLFIKGGESNYIQEENRANILALFPQAKVKVMPGCGHWLHAQQPRLFNGIVERFLRA
jgi:esterase